MALYSVPGMSVTGIVSTVPEKTEDNLQLTMLDADERLLLVKKTGIKQRRIAPPDVSAIDLCAKAASVLLEQSGSDPRSVGITVFVTQTPDFPIPGNSMACQQLLGLNKDCLLYDIHQGCAGYVYGLSVICGLMQGLQIDKGLLLVGDTLSHLLSPADRSTVPLFSDAGSATLIQRSVNESHFHFNLGADGNGAAIIRVKGGGARYPFNSNSLDLQEDMAGIQRSPVHLQMEGIDVMNYSLTHVVPNIESMFGTAGIDKNSIDYFVLHQANRILNEMIQKRLKLPAEKFPETLSMYGNTSCASIPVTITACLGQLLKARPMKLLLSGFGAGFSWGSVVLNTMPGIICPPPVQLNQPYGR